MLPLKKTPCGTTYGSLLIRKIPFLSLLTIVLWAGCPSDTHANPVAAWKTDVAYGEHALQKLDIYRPTEGDGPFPIVIDIHGGGWWNGDKAYAAGGANNFLKRGAAFIPINYRCLPQAKEAGIFPPVMGPLQDAKRALQFIRLHAKEWNLDPSRIALSGGSAGGFSALWLALSPDMAEPTSTDPVAQQSTKVLAVGVVGAQTSIDPEQMRKWVGPELKYGGHAFGLDEKDFDTFLAKRAEFEKYFATISPAALVNKNSPPIYLNYDSSPDDPNKDGMYYVHSPSWGIEFQKLAISKGATCCLSYKNHSSEEYRGDYISFLVDKIGAKSPMAP